MKDFYLDEEFCFHNRFGRNAKDCKLLKNEGLKIGKSDFSVAFWIKTQLCGLSHHPRSFFSLSTMLLHFNKTEKDSFSGFDEIPELGGVIMSNTSCTFANENGFSFLALPYEGCFVARFCGQGRGGFMKPLDDRWHFIAATFDRDDACSLYCDEELLCKFDIKNSRDTDVDSDGVGIGCDAAGDWGFQNGFLKKVLITGHVLTQKERQALYFPEAIELEKTAINDRMGLCAEYGSTEKAKRLLNSMLYKNRATYKKIKDAHESMISSGTPRVVFALLSDVHILDTKPAAVKIFRSAMADLRSFPFRLDGLICGGDFTHDSTSEAIDYGWNIFREEFSKTSIPKATICIGNHELWMGNKGCYKTGMPSWLKNIKPYRDDDSLSPVYYENQMAGFKFFVLNCDPPSDNRLTRHQTHLSKMQLDWLNCKMEESYKNKEFVFVMLHQPFRNTYHLTGREYGDWDVGNEDGALRTILSKYDNFLYICGHMHQAFNIAPIFMVDDKFPSLQIPGLDYTPKNFCMPGTGYILFVYENLLIFRARDYLNGQWLTEYDKAIRLKDGWRVDKVMNSLESGFSYYETDKF
ncbi:metallophosphoesterase [Treponema parvum]|uniref:Metallophosphoesterase n=1 Tax=Treponema parvum TaxID=138851 RepID=A0A975F3U2_9SPIR|nr:metallophosphoesterase [Treponema parvum]QTQ13881.1 metallophosphoesterase [Treponema parvum]